MIDYTLERRITDLIELKGHWMRFREFYRIGERKQKPTKEQDHAFLENKKKIALLHEELTDSLPPGDDKVGRRMAKHAQGILEHVIRCVTIKHIQTFYEQDHKIFETDWNNAYLLLNETIGLLEDRRAELANLSHTTIATREAMDSTKRWIKNFITGWVPKTFLPIILFIGVPIIVHILDLYTIQQAARIHENFRGFYESVHNATKDNLGVELPYAYIENIPRSPQLRLDSDAWKIIEEKDDDIGSIGVMVNWVFDNSVYDKDRQPYKFLNSDNMKKVIGHRYEKWYTGRNKGPVEIHFIFFKSEIGSLHFRKLINDEYEKLKDYSGYLGDPRTKLKNGLGKAPPTIFGRKKNVVFVIGSTDIEARDACLRAEFEVENENTFPHFE